MISKKAIAIASKQAECASESVGVSVYEHKGACVIAAVFGHHVQAKAWCRSVAARLTTLCGGTHRVFTEVNFFNDPTECGCEAWVGIVGGVDLVTKTEFNAEKLEEDEQVDGMMEVYRRNADRFGHECAARSVIEAALRTESKGVTA